MNRFHVHVNVNDLSSNIQFYTTLFGVEPSVVKSDYAKWMLEDPRINFAISQRGRAAGVDHLGIQAEAADGLSEIGRRLEAADAVALAEKATTCCYARSDKFWAEDPQGVRWESFFTHGEATTYSAPSTAEPVVAEQSVACCGPKTTAASTPSNCGPATTAAKCC